MMFCAKLALSLPPHWSLLSIWFRYRMIDCTEEWRDRMESLMTETSRPDFIGKGRDNMNLRHKGYRVLSIKRVENLFLWKRYVLQRSLVAAKIPQGAKAHECVKVESWRSWQRDELSQNFAANEVFLFHGLHHSLVNQIAKEGFDERVCNLKGMFGAGIYLAENSSKSDEYCVENSTNSSFMFLVRATLGAPYEALQPMKRHRRPPCTEGHLDVIETRGVKTVCSHPRLDSVIAPTTKTHAQAALCKYREFIVYDKTQSYPEFIIEFKRI